MKLSFPAFWCQIDIGIYFGQIFKAEILASHEKVQFSIGTALSLTCPEQEVLTQVSQQRRTSALLYINRTPPREKQRPCSHTASVWEWNHVLSSQCRSHYSQQAGVQEEDQEETLCAAEGEGSASQWSRSERPDVGGQPLGRCVFPPPVDLSTHPAITHPATFRSSICPLDHAQINDLSQVPVPVMLLPDDFRASTKIKVSNHLFNKYGDCCACRETITLHFISQLVSYQCLQTSFGNSDSLLH